MQISPRRQAALQGIGQWFGEAVIGLIPLALYEVVAKYSKLPVTATCQKSGTALLNCVQLSDNPGQEICILAVVISGLAVLSVVPQNRRRHATVFTRLLTLAAVLALIFGSLFYFIFTSHLDLEADAITYYVLIVALASSFFLSIEGAILGAEPVSAAEPAVSAEPHDA